MQSNNDYDGIIFRQSINVILRPILKKDLDLFLKWMNDPMVTKFLTCNAPVMEACEEKWIEKLPERAPKDYIVGIVVDNKLIGTMGLHDIDHISGIATTGAFIGERDYWGKGYGTEAKMLLLDLAFNTLNLRKICSEVIAFNGRSVKYSQKCGYKPDGGPKVAHVYKNGQYHDIIQLAVFREDWLPLWQKFTKEHNITT